MRHYCAPQFVFRQFMTAATSAAFKLVSDVLNENVKVTTKGLELRVTARIIMLQLIESLRLLEMYNIVLLVESIIKTNNKEILNCFLLAQPPLNPYRRAL